jgi:hypothetical protein
MRPSKLNPSQAFLFQWGIFTGRETLMGHECLGSLRDKGLDPTNQPAPSEIIRKKYLVLQSLLGDSRHLMEIMAETWLRPGFEVISSHLEGPGWNF